MTACCLKNYHMWFKSLAHGGRGDRVRVKFRSTSLHLCTVGQGLCVRATSDGCCLELWCPWAALVPWDPASLLGPVIQGSRGGSKRHSKPRVGAAIFILGTCNIYISCMLPLKRRNKLRGLLVIWNKYHIFNICPGSHLWSSIYVGIYLYILHTGV